MCIQNVDIVSSISGIFNNTAVGAFLGSFSAFIFGIIAYDYTKRRERYKIHHDAVVKAEQLANRHLNEISGNIYLLKGALDTYKKGAFSENVLSPLENPDLLTDFHNLEIMNNYTDYQSLVDKVNHDTAAWNKSNDRLFTTALSGKISHIDIDINRKSLAERTEQLMHHLEDLMQETYTFGGYIREFLKIDKRASFARLGPTENISIDHKKAAKERERFVKESEATMEKDRAGRLKKYKI